MISSKKQEPAAKNEDDIILPIQKTEQQPEKDTAQVEIIKSPAVPEKEKPVAADALEEMENEDEEEQSQPPLEYDDEGNLLKTDKQSDTGKVASASPNVPVQQLNDPIPLPKENNSILSGFVESIINATASLKPPKRQKRFDAQKLLDRIRVLASNATNIGERDYKLLTCKAQPYLQRITVLGEFF